MNRSLRKSHLRRSMALALLLPLGLGAALLNRRAQPVADAQAWELVAVDPDATVDTGEASSLVLDGVTVLLSRSKAGIRLASQELLVQPDLLVYWSTEDAQAKDALPANVHLLGTFRDAIWRPLELPSSTPAAPGYVLLYSLAHAQVLGSFTLAEE